MILLICIYIITCIKMVPEILQFLIQSFVLLLESLLHPECDSDSEATEPKNLQVIIREIP